MTTTTHIFRRSVAPAGSSLLGLLLVLGAATGCGRDADADAGPPPHPLATDKRLELLIIPCERGGYYDRDTSEAIEIMVGKLELSHPEQMRRAKEELGAIGDAAVPALTRMVQRWFDDPGNFAHVQNALEALSMGKARTAHDAILLCLEHSTDTIRLRALRALASGHARKSDYDRIYYRLQTEPYDLQRTAALGLFTADSARATLQLLEWLENGLAKDLWGDLLPHLAEATDPAVLERVAALVDSEWPQIRIWATAITAAQGDLEADAALRELLAESELSERTIAVQAAVATGLVQLLEPVLAKDPNGALRVMAAEALGRRASEEPYRAWLLAALNDPDKSVRQVVLRALLVAGDETALGRLIGLLEGRRAHLQQAVNVITGVLPDDSPAARRAFETLARIDRAQDHLSLGERSAVLQAIGLLPLGDAAEYLRDAGLAAEQGAQGMSAYGWAMLRAANSGIPGRRRLAELLPTETDPVRRIDMLWAISSRRDDLTREALTAAVLDPETDPYEVLFCAQRLANTGPMTYVAPLLKRVTLTITDPVVRPALECLLWRWY